LLKLLVIKNSILRWFNSTICEQTLHIFVYFSCFTKVNFTRKDLWLLGKIINCLLDKTKTKS